MSSKSDNPASKSGNPADAIQAQLSEKMLGVFDMVVSSRNTFYKENPEAIPTKERIPLIIQSAARNNMLISGSASLIPGPLGMVAVVPEISLVIKNQVEMIYDIGIAYGQQKYLNRELLASVFAFALGTSGMGLLVMQGSKVLVKRASLRVFQRLITMLAGKVTQRVLKSMLSKWVPVVGAAAMATWSNISTRQVGNQAIAIFSKDLQMSDEEVGEEDLEDNVIAVTKDTTRSSPIVTRADQGNMSPEKALEVDDSQNNLTPNLDVLKTQTLINLMKVDGEIEESEQGFIQQILEGLDCSQGDRSKLLEYMSGSKKFDIDYQLIADSPDDAISLMVDMVTLAKRDEKFHVAEKLYIKRVGKMLNFANDEIQELMEV